MARETCPAGKLAGASLDFAMGVGWAHRERLAHSNRSGGLQEKWYTLHQQGGRRHEMSSMWSRTTIQRAVAVTCGLLIGLPAIFAQTPGDQTMGTPDTQQTAPLLSPDQLNNLVAPIAL